MDHVDLKSLTDIGVAVRYPDDFYIPDEAETKHYITVAEEISRIVKKLIN